MNLVKTVDLPTNKNYLFAFFPHGVSSVSAYGNFASSATNFKELFPRIRSKFCTLNFHFFIPLYRDLLLSLGMISVKASSIKKALSQSNDERSLCNQDGFTSNAVKKIFQKLSHFYLIFFKVVIAVGGSQEALHARSGNYRLVLKNRKGFIKIAIQTGALLVPVFSFGEIDVFDQPSNEPGTKIRKFQEAFKKWTGIVPPILNIFDCRNCQITTVIGAPILVKQVESPSAKQVDELHEKFIKKLRELYDDHKEKYVKNYQDVLLIIE